MIGEASVRFPLSFQQGRAWQQHLQGASRRATGHVELSGPVDAERLRHSIQEVVSRHEALLVVLSRESASGLPTQQVQSSCDFVWAQENLTRRDPSEQTAWLSHWLESQVDRGEPKPGPSLRVLLATLSAHSYALLLSLPAYCADTVSVVRLVDLIALAYAGEPANDEDAFQYGDFAVWQQEIFTHEDAWAGREFWQAYQRQLQTRNWGRAWPSIIKRSSEAPTQTYRLALAPSRIAGIDALSSRHQVPFSLVLLACWHVLLARVSQLPTQLIGFECDGRDYPEFRNAIGPFARRIPLQTSTETDTTFADLVANLRTAVDEIQGWQQSFAGLPDSADSVIVPEVGFDCVELTGERHSAGVRFTLVQAESESEGFVLRLSARRQENQLWLELHFDSSRLNLQTIQEWGESFLNVLAGAVEDSRRSVARMPMLSEAQQHRLLVEWNQTTAEYPRTRCMQELVEEQAERTPDRTAVRCMDRHLTYRELNEQANQLALCLRMKGVGPDQRVGLCADRSLQMVVGLLGILKAGGAYVPLNAEHPPMRLAQQLQGAVALVTEEGSLSRTADFPGAVVCLDRDQAELQALPRTNLPLQTTPESLVYVLFTSGSTGVPKGVAARHRNLVNYTWFARNLLELEKYPEGLQFALVSTVCADVGITCIYPALTSGGCLHVIPYDVAADSARYGEYASQAKIDVLKIVPSHLLALLSAGGGKAVLPSKFVVVGGERLTRELMEKITAEEVGCEVVNHYAPSETTCGSLTLRMSRFDWRHWQGASMPLGRPIANTRLYVLDVAGEPVPVGAIGELYIAGDGVSAGYVGDPQRTKERFLPDRFVAGSTMYRSGDVVRYVADGNIEFLERIDDQVKIRGFRVELGEVQAALEAHGGVKQSVVLARDGDHGKRVLGWVVAREGVALTETELREHVKLRLPEYMVPTRVVVLAKMPLTQNGKIDRQGLPEPEALQQQTKPRTAMEEMVAAVWREVLEDEQIGVEQNFFEIGGHSLLATQIIARLRERLDVAIPVRMLFDHPTIAALANEMEHIQRENVGLAPPPIRLVPRNGALPLSLAQEGIWVHDQFEPHNPLYNIPRAWRLKGPLQVAALQRSLNEIVRRHESQRTTFAIQGERPVQVIAKSLHIPIARYDLTSLPAEDRKDAGRRIIEDEAIRPFDLERGPLVRAHLIGFSDDDHVFLMVLHHIISDAWSAGVFFRELKALYEAFLSGAESPLPTVRIQYGDYAVHERQWLQGEVLEKHAAYWRQELAGAPPLLELPTDRPRFGARSFRGSLETMRLSPDVAQSVKQLSRLEGTTPFTVLMSAFQTLLWRHSGQSQIVVGTDFANRNTPEVEEMLGFFVNVLPIRADFSGDPTFRNMLGRVRQSLLGAHAHHQLPLAKIVQEVQPTRSSSHNPVVQALFVYQNAPATEQSLSGLQVGPFDVPVTSSKFDLAVFVAEERDALVAHWTYSVDLFERATILEMGRRFETLLQELILNPDKPLGCFERYVSDGNPPQDAGPTKCSDDHRAPLEATGPQAGAGRDARADCILPESPMEETIAGVWCEVLGLERIGVDENLFEIGGHSLVATQIAARLRSRFGLAIYVRTLFDHPTVRELARLIEKGGNELMDGLYGKIERVPRIPAK
jgi:amino acid adenylation domain-containing protein